MILEQPPSSPAENAARSGCLPLVFALLVLFIGAVRLIYNLLTVEIPERSLEDTFWTLGISALLAAVLWLLRRQARTVRQRAIYNTWLMVLPLPVLLIPTTWFMPVQSQWAALARVGLLLVYALFVRWLVGRRRGERVRAVALRVALVSAAWLAYPWLLWGALGSVTDVILALAAAALFGWSAAQVIAQFWRQSWLVASHGVGREILHGGFVVAVMLLLMTRNLGFNNGSLVLGMGLPLLGWLVMAISVLGLPDHREAATNWPAVAVLLALVTAYPLLLADTDTLPLLFLFQGEGLVWALLAALLTALIGLLLGPLWGALRPSLGSGAARPGIGMAAAAFWLIGAFLYFSWGHPGFYGDRFFVILADQVDLSAAAASADYDQRRTAVYRTLVEHAVNTQANLRRTLERFGIGYTPYYLVNGLEVEGNVLVQLWLAQHPAVDRIVPAPILRPLWGAPALLGADDEIPPLDPPWNMEAIGATRVWTELSVRGEGIVVGQSDSGVQWDHPALAGRYRGVTGNEVNHNYHWYDPWAHTPAPVDAAGHGTHTLGTVLGETVGVAPGAEWFACRNLARNVGNAAYYLDCMQFMLAPFPLGGDPFTGGNPLLSAHVTNNSWGCPQDMEGCDPDTLRQGAEALRAAGIFTVVSAGNEGPECGTVAAPLAIYDAVFSVGATDLDGDLAPFSSVGPVSVNGRERVKPDLVAPGVAILSTAPADAYILADGTSSAGPHVAGVVALMWSANPNLIGDIERSEQILTETATPFSGRVETWPLPAWLADAPCPIDADTVPNNLTGYGIVNAYGAVQRALEMGRTSAAQ